MRKTKLGIPRGVREWENLESAGDIKRFLRWVVLSMRDNRLDRQDAVVFGQLGNTLARVIESSDLERRLEKLEETVDRDKR